MNEKFQQLYDYIKSQDMTDLGEQEFYDSYSNPDKFGELFGYVKSQNMTDLGEQEFFSAYFGGDVEKKSPNGTGEEEVMESVTETETVPTGSSDSSSQEPEYDYETIQEKEEVFGLPSEVSKQLTDQYEQLPDFNNPNTQQPTSPSEEVARLFEVQKTSDEFTQDQLDNPENVVDRALQDIRKGERLVEGGNTGEYTSDFFEQSLKQVNADLIDSEEQEVVPLMNSLFGDYGFDFKEGGGFSSGLDGMTVVAANGKEIAINLDPVFGDIFAGESAPANDLKKFLRDNRKESESIVQKFDGYIEKKAKFQSEEQVKIARKNVNSFSKETLKVGQELINLNVQLKELEQVTPIGEKGEALKKQQVDILKSKISEQESKYKKMDSSMKIQGAELDRSVGEWEQMRSNQIGSTFDVLTHQVPSIVYNTLLDGLGRMAAGAMDYTGDLASSFIRESYKGTGYEDRVVEIAKEKGYIKEGETYDEFIERLDEQANRGGGIVKIKDSRFEEIDSQIRDEFLKKQKYGKIEDSESVNPYSQIAKDRKYNTSKGILSEIRKGFRKEFGMESVSTTATDMIKKDSFVGGAFLGAIESIPAMLLPGAGQLIGMSLQVSDHVNEEMANNPEFDNVSENEKSAIKIPLSITVGLLERLGFRNVLAQKGFANAILLRALGKSGINTAGKSFNQVVKKEINNLMAQGALVVGAGGLAEFETGFAQEVADITTKVVYNTIKEKDMFQTPETIWDGFKQSMYAGAQELVGSFVISTPIAINMAAKKGDFTQIDNETFRIFEQAAKESVVRDAFEAKLKERVASGELSSKQASKELEIYNQVSGLVNEIPSDLPTKQKKKYLGNLLRQQELNDYIDKYNKQLTKRQQAELKKLEEEIPEITREGLAALEEESRHKEVINKALTELKAEGITEPTAKQINNKIDAIQKSSTEKVDAQKSTEDSTEVGEGVIQPKDTEEGITETEGEIEEATQEEIDPQEASDLEVSMTEFTGVEPVVTEQVTQEETAPLQEGEVEINTSEGTSNVKGVKVSDNITVVEDTTLGETQKAANKILTNLVVKASNAVKRIMPNLQFVLHDSKESYNNAVSEGFRDTRGSYNSTNNTIHVNNNSANAITVYHEVAHAMLVKALGDNVTQAQINKLTKRLLTSAFKGIKDPVLKKEIEDFGNQYDKEGTQEEESFVQFIGYLGANYTKFDKPTQNLIKRWLNKIAKIIGLPSSVTKYLKEDEDAIKFFETFSRKLREGEVITEEDIEILPGELEQGEAGEVGTIKIPTEKAQIKVIDSPNAKDDTRPWVRDVVDNVDLTTLQNEKFLTNMYDYTNAGITDLGNGYSLNLFGGRNYVPYIMDLLGLKLGDVSHLAAFNTKSQAEGFIRNAVEGEANMFAPHSGTLNGSWQFQQHIFEQLVDLVLDNNILSNKDIIKLFNYNLRNEVAKKTYAARIKSIKEKGYYTKKVEGKEVKVTKRPAKPSQFLSAFKKFRKASGLDINNLDSFESNPKELVRLLNIENNFSPDLRKNLNQKIAANKKFQEAIGVKNLNEFHQKIMDPLNKGVVGGEIMTFIKFDPSTLEIIKTDPNGVEHHPSFGWVVKAKIEKILQPTKFYKSYDITESYTKYNSDETVVSRKTETDMKDFKSSNVSSSAGAIVKVAEVAVEKAQKNYKSTEINTPNATLSLVEGAGENSFEIATKDYKSSGGTNGSTIIGFVKNTDFPGEKKKETRGEVFILQVNDKGKGIGTSLMLDALRLMKENGSNTVKFTVPSKEGKPFNESLVGKGYIKLLKVSDRTGTSEYSITDKVLEDTPSIKAQKNLAPNGQPSNLNEEQYKLVRTPAFKKWFGDWETDPKNASKVVDENGEPMVMYHGTREDFDVFSKEFANKNTKELERNQWFWFSDKKDMAETYGFKILPVFLSAKNPLSQEKEKINILFDKAVRENKDGLILEDFTDVYRTTQKLAFKDDIGEVEILIDDRDWTGYIANEALADPDLTTETLISDLEYTIEDNKNEIKLYEKEYDVEYNYTAIEQATQLLKAVKKGGKEAIQVTDEVKGTVVAIPTSNQVKLADGSNKTFDPQSPSIKAQKNSPQLQAIVRNYNMNLKGFFPPTIYAPQVKALAQNLGFGLEEARVRDRKAYDFGRLTGYYLTRPNKNGEFKKFNPRGNEKAQKPQNTNDLKKFKDEVDIIREGRKLNYKDATIKDYLTRVRDFSVKKVNELMKFDADLFTVVPKSFGNVEGGMVEGLKLYQRAVKKYSSLVKENNKPARKNARKPKVKLTEQELLDQTIDFLKQQEEYKKLDETYTVGSKKKGTQKTLSRKAPSTIQRLVEIELAESLGAKKSSDLAAAIRKSRLILNAKTKGVRELKAVQRELRNFLRKTLPKDVYTKQEVMTLINKINAATFNEGVNNIQNIQDEVVIFAAKKNNVRLEKEIDQLLNIVTQKRNTSGTLKGVTVDDNTRVRLESLKDRINKGGFKTVDEVINYIAELNEEFNELSKKPIKEESDYSEMANIQMILNLVQANELMDNSDVAKVEMLDTVLSQLNQIISTGKTALKDQLKEANQEYLRQFKQVYRDIVGKKETFEETAIANLLEDGNDNPTQEEIEEEVEDIIENLKVTVAASVRESNAKYIGKKFKGLLNNTLTLFTRFQKQSDLFLLMAEISKLPADLFEGITQEEVTDTVDKASRLYKERMMMNEAMVIFKYKELFGNRYKKTVAKFTRKSATGIYVNAELVAKAETNYKNNPTPENKVELNRVKKQQEIILSPNQMYYLYNQYKTPANHPGFKNESLFGADYKRVMKELTAKLENENPKLKEFADWQVDTLFPALYEHYNAAYKDIYRTQMPYNVNYAGMLYRDGVEPEGIDLLSGSSSQYNNIVTANSSKGRVNNNVAIKPVDGTDALFTYFRDMEYFAAYARPITNIDKLFSNDIISKSIKALYGDRTMEVINHTIKKLSNKGMSETDVKMDKAVDIMQDTFIFSRLGINPVVTIKQLTSAVTYANDIGYATWMKNAALSRFFGKSSVADVWKEISENSVYLKDRGTKSITKSIEAYSESKMESVMPDFLGVSAKNRESLISILMYTTKIGDIGAIYLGGVPNYVHYKKQFKKKNPDATDQEATKQLAKEGIKKPTDQKIKDKVVELNKIREQQAIDFAITKFERDTKRTQQSTDLQDRDYYQARSPFHRAMNMFLTTPKQYLRREVYAIREFYRLLSSGGKQGKGRKRDHARTFFTYHVVMPVFFQYVANGLPGILADWDEEDKDDLIGAAILGNLNAVFILGELLVNIKDFVTGKPWAFDSDKNLPILTQGFAIGKAIKKWDSVKDPVLKEKYLYKLLAEIGNSTGLPASQMQKIYKNANELIEGGEDPGKVILRLFNFSEYQISGPKEKGGKKKKKSSKRMKDPMDEMSYKDPMDDAMGSKGYKDPMGDDVGVKGYKDPMD